MEIAEPITDVEAGYSLGDVERILSDIPRRSVGDWFDQGLLVATQPARGKGTQRRLSRGDLMAIRVFNTLVKQGFSRKLAAQIVGDLPEIERRGERVALLVLRVSIDVATGESRRDVTAIGEGANQLDLTTGRTQGMQDAVERGEHQGDPMADKEWTDVTVINLAAHRKRIDEALGRF
jgi:hypothetical protein